MAGKRQYQRNAGTKPLNPEKHRYVYQHISAESILKKFLQAAVNKEFLKLRGRTRIPVASKRDGQHFKPE
jgi:hypothetical protein